MTERPILFSAPMVRALLDGRKTQTRRAINPQPISPLRRSALLSKSGRPIWTDGGSWVIPCPYGGVGDRLYVRENGWERPERTPKMMREGADTWEPYYFDADGLTDADREQFRQWGFKRRPSIHMPRRFSRIDLEITGVRVERVQDISEEDAKAEGATLYEPENYLSHGGWSHDGRYVHASARKSLEALWEQINGAGSWAVNPWVWVVEFKRVRP